MNQEQEYKKLKRKLKENEGRLATNKALQQVKKELLFKKLGKGVDTMKKAEEAIKKLGISAKKAESGIKVLLKKLKEQDAEA